MVDDTERASGGVPPSVLERVEGQNPPGEASGSDARLTSQPVPVGTVTLSRRQIECLARISMGETTAEIAVALGLSRHTVDHYVGAACNRLGARSRAHAVAIAVAAKVIEPCNFA